MKPRLGALPLTKVEIYRRLRAKRHAQGLCWYCTQPIAPGSKGQCVEHLTIKRLRTRQTPKTGKWQPGSVGRPPLWAKASGLVGNVISADGGDMTRCLFCGCTDATPCVRGCCWLLRSQSKEWGVCSACDAQLRELVGETGEWLRRQGVSR